MIILRFFEIEQYILNFLKNFNFEDLLQNITYHYAHGE